jgi:hypothetical protein
LLVSCFVRPCSFVCAAAVAGTDGKRGEERRGEERRGEEDPEPDASDSTDGRARESRTRVRLLVCGLWLGCLTDRTGKAAGREGRGEEGSDGGRQGQKGQAEGTGNDRRHWTGST